MRILAIAGLIILGILLIGYVFIRISAPHLMEFSRGVKEFRIEIRLDSLKNARFIQGMEGCENLWLNPSGMGLYVTSIEGKIYYLDGSSTESLRIQRTVNAGSTVTGICSIGDSLLAIMVSDNSGKEWIKKGGAVYLTTFALDSFRRISEDYPAANGICSDQQGNLYFASSNFHILHPKGNIYIMKKLSGDRYGSPEALFKNVGLANGLYYDSVLHRIFFSNTVGGVYWFATGSKDYRAVYLKTRFMEACDDLCTDTA